MKQKLRLENIDLGGLVDQANIELDAAISDAIDRYRLKGARSIQINISLIPEVREIHGREIIQLIVDYSVSKPKLPATKGVTNKATVIDGKAVISTDDPMGEDLPGQTRLPLDQQERMAG